MYFSEISFADRGNRGAILVPRVPFGGRTLKGSGASAGVTFASMVDSSGSRSITPSCVGASPYMSASASPQSS